MFKPRISLPTLPLGKRGFLHGKRHPSGPTWTSLEVLKNRVSARHLTGKRQICCLHPRHKARPWNVDGLLCFLTWQLYPSWYPHISRWLSWLSPYSEFGIHNLGWKKKHCLASFPHIDIAIPPICWRNRLLAGYTFDHTFHKNAYRRFTSYSMLVRSHSWLKSLIEE